MRKPFIAGNWKLNKSPNETIALLEELKPLVAGVEDVDIAVMPPFTSINVATFLLKNSNIKVGAQNMYFEKSGAFTGEVSGDMIKELGCDYVILGHSERRTLFGDTDEMINKKLKVAFETGLIPIFCVGETLAEREAEKTFAVIETQVKDGLKGIADIQEMVIAYEPVWAIGTGKTATPEQANDVHVFIRGLIKDLYGEEKAAAIRIQYGGSVKPGNVKELMAQPDIDGGLIGGAALTAEDFAALINFGK